MTVHLPTPFEVATALPLTTERAERRSRPSDPNPFPRIRLFRWLP